MNDKNSIICIILILFFFSSSSGQFDGYTPIYSVQSTDIYMEANIFQQDFLYYCDALVNTHPNVFLNYPEDKFETNKKNALDILSHCNNEEEFSMILQQFIAPIKDTHTKVTNIWFPGEKRYPIRYKFYGDSLYILNMTNQLPTEFYGTILHSINGFSLEDIKMKAAQYTSYENEVGLKNNINLSIYKSDFLRTLGIIKNETDSITIETTGKRKWTIHPNSNSNWQIKFISHPITEKKKANFDYQILKDDKICYLQLNKFIDKRIAERYIELLPFWKKLVAKIKMWFGSVPEGYDRSFPEFLNEMMSEINKNDINNLIIDLRHSSGGSMQLGRQLLYFLGIDKYKSFCSEINKSDLYKIQMSDLGVLKTEDEDTSDTNHSGIVSTHDTEEVDKIIHRFGGNVYFLIAEWTYSSAVMLATTIKDNKLFTIVGEPTSQRPSHFGELLFLKLPNTKIVCNISCKQFHRPDREKDNEDTLFPDVIIMKTFKSLDEGKDLAFDWIISHINNN